MYLAVPQAPSALVELHDIEDGRYGGKALGLAELTAAGFSVPSAFVIADADPNALPAGLHDRWDQLSRNGSASVAVRSSAAGEDGAESSFAGQYESVLGVTGYDDFVDAIRQCVDSTSSNRAMAYQAEAGMTGAMHLVVQQMVDARAAGVVFTADPASARRDLAVVDAVTGLGESLVDGSTTSDHYEIDRAGQILDRQTGLIPALTDHDVTTIATRAREAEDLWGRPLDLEWALDQDGQIRWLQARPITTLPADLNEMDSKVAGAEHVYTRCNIGEMMPGAFCPLTASVSGQAIEYAMQIAQITGGGQESYEADRWLQLGYFSGHMFLNMTEGTALSSGILGNSLEQYSLSIAGRVVDELVPKPPKPFGQRVLNTLRLSAFALTASTAIRRLDKLLAATTTPSATSPAALLAQLDATIELYNEATLTHVRSSSRSAVAANIMEDTVVRAATRAGRTEDEGRTKASALLAGATNVESAVLLEQLDDIVSRLAENDAAAEQFRTLDAADAVVWLIGVGGQTSALFDAFLTRHGHRGYRELCMRDPSWADDGDGLGAIMQAMLRARRAPGGVSSRPTTESVAVQASRLERGMAKMAHAGARGRESTKSRMVLVACRLKRGYRLLGEQLATAGILPDADLVFFFDRGELPLLLGTGDVTDLVARAQARRRALPFQARLEFPDVSVGKPTPMRPVSPEVSDGVIVGRPACSGVVEGTVRIATTITEAQALQPGEILVAPVTDVGWTPYFTLIAALVTDIGSSVSHGAVVAREYGLPCVVNTQGATLVLATGDRVRVDGDRGTVTLLAAAAPVPD